jgi:glycerol-3-phosphate dehydrogenase
MDREPSLAAPLATGSTALAAEIVFAFEHELARTLEDVLARRTMLALGPRLGLDVVEQAARIAQRCMGWDDERVRREIESYRRYVRRFDVPG